MSTQAPSLAAVPSLTSDTGFFSEKAKVVAALVSVYVAWGSTYMAIRVALESFPPFVMAGIRFTVAGAILFAWTRFRGAPAPTWRQWKNALFLGILFLAIGNGGVVVAEQYVASSLAAVAVGAVALFTALFSGLLGHWPRKLEWVGLFIGAMGVLLLNLDGDLRASPLGAFLLILAPACWALATVLSPRMDRPAGAMASASQMLMGGAFLLLLSIPQWRQVTVPTPRATLALLYLIVAGSLVGYSAYVYLIGKVRPSLATSYAYVNPVVAVILGVTLLGERLTGFGLAGTALIPFAVAMIAINSNGGRKI